MKLPNGLAEAIDWAEAPESARKGEPGTATARTRTFGGVQTRIITYSPGYVSDHWCPKGHIFHVLEGAFTFELKNGRTFQLEKGMSFVTGDDEAAPHRLITKSGATVFIVDEA